jgi:hypothetical protein
MSTTSLPLAQTEIAERGQPSEARNRRGDRTSLGRWQRGSMQITWRDVAGRPVWWMIAGTGGVAAVWAPRVAAVWMLAWVVLAVLLHLTAARAAGARPIHDRSGLAAAWSRCVAHAEHGARAALHVLVLDAQTAAATDRLAIRVAAMVRRTDLVARIGAGRIVILQPLLIEAGDAAALRNRLARWLADEGARDLLTRPRLGTAALGPDGRELTACLAAAERRALGTATTAFALH